MNRDNIDKSVIALYLKYGLINTPTNKSFFLKKKNKSFKFLKLNRKYVSNIDDIDKEIYFNLENKIKNSVKKKEKIFLMMSAGNDSRLMYHYTFDICKKFNYLNKFYVITGNFKNYKNKYSDFKYIKQNRKYKIHNHIILNIGDSFINYEKFIKLIIKLIKVNKIPINGLRYYLMYRCIEHICKKNKKHLILTGIGDSIFNKYVSSDKIIREKSNYLTKEYNKIADSEFKNLKKPKFFKFTKRLDHSIHKRHYFLLGPKTKFEFDGIFKYFNANYYNPFYEKKILELCLNYKYKGLSKKINKYIIFKLLEKKENMIIDFNLDVDTPQREYIYKLFKNNKKFIEKSLLISKNIVSKTKMENEVLKYSINFKKKINTKSDKDLNSYSLWKFLVTELFLKINN